MQSVRGMRDILPAETPQWQRVESIVASWMERYGYQEIRTPIVEYAELFYHGVGTETDAVGKEMYIFPDRGGELLALRPELTAPIARAIIQHSLHKQSPILRLWYYGACFRYERPQKGRQRQFHQVGAECIGYSTPDADAEIIALAWDIISSIATPSTIELVINTLGTEDEQHSYRTRLVEYLERYHTDLSEISRQRLRTNPLRVLDSKEEADRRIIATAPTLHQILSPESTAHYEMLKQLLSDLGIPFTEDPFLVRGLDYYTHTVFEFRSSLLGAQDAIGGGGRYDNLVARLGGDRLPGVGFGIGVERLLLAQHMPEHHSQQWRQIVYVAAEPSHQRQIHTLVHTIRSHGIACISDLQFRSLKAQLRQANKLGCRIVLLVGIPEGQLSVKDMKTGQQYVLSPEIRDIVDQIKALEG